MIRKLRLLRNAWLLTCVTCLVGAAPVRDDGFLAYWAKFRANALHGDMTSLATLSRFSLRASLLSDPQNSNRITRTQFPMLFRTEMNCPSKSGRSLLNVIRTGVKFTGNDYHNMETASINKLSFDRAAGQWKLIQLDYADVEDFHKRLSGRC